MPFSEIIDTSNQDPFCGLLSWSLRTHKAFSELRALKKMYCPTFLKGIKTNLRIKFISPKLVCLGIRMLHSIEKAQRTKQILLWLVCYSVHICLWSM